MNDSFALLNGGELVSIDWSHFLRNHIVAKFVVHFVDILSVSGEEFLATKNILNVIECGHGEPIEPLVTDTTIFVCPLSFWNTEFYSL